MAVQVPHATDMRQALGLTGITINAMALIAPGAFLWTTFQTQSISGGTSMWAAVFIAVLIALLTAITYSALANRYPEAGTGSSYYYAEAAVFHQKEHRHFKFARMSKFIVGWASHLYYWIYPGVMVAFMSLVIEYITQQSFDPNFGTGPGGPFELITICVVFSTIVGAIAYVGVTGSTIANILINVIQILALLTFSFVAIVFRINHPELHYVQSSALAVFTPKSFNDVIFQSTIAILLVVGFESATALAAEAKNPKRDIPRGVVLSLLIQGVVFYLFEYFAANFAIGDYYKSASGTGFAAAGASGAPIGDIAQFIGNSVFNGQGKIFAVLIATSVVIALVGTALSCLNTGARVTYAMGRDRELPAVFGFLHGEYCTPHMAVIALAIISAIVGSYGVLGVDNLLQVTLISNIGTFLLYGMTCIVGLIAFAGTANRKVFSTFIAPLLGAILNGAMLVGVLYYAIVGASNTRFDTIVASVFSIGFLALGFAFLYLRQLISGVPILHPEDHKTRATISRGLEIVVTRKLGPLVNTTGLLALEPSVQIAGDTGAAGYAQTASLDALPKKPEYEDNDWNTPTQIFDSLVVQKTSRRTARDADKAIRQLAPSQATSLDTVPVETVHQDNDWDTPTIIFNQREMQKSSLQAARDAKKAMSQPELSQTATPDTMLKDAEH